MLCVIDSRPYCFVSLVSCRLPLFLSLAPYTFVMIIDIHNHVGLSEGGTYGEKEELLSLMDSCAIDKAVIFAIDEKERGDTYSLQNDAIMKLVKQKPDKFIGFCRIQPKAGQKAVDEMVRTKKMGMMGLKLHPRTDKFMPEDAREVLKMAEKFAWPVLLHTDHHSDYPLKDWVNTIQRFSSLVFILAHGGKDDWCEAGQIAMASSNVYLETSTLSYNRSKFLIETVGCEKMLFGSDYPYSHPYLEKKKYELIIEDKAKLERVLGGNAKKLLRL